MAKAIYILKMYMLRHQLPRGNGIMSEQEKRAVVRMTNFIVLYYAKYYLQSALSTAAPRLDLQFWKDITSYQVTIQDTNHYNKNGDGLIPNLGFGNPLLCMYKK